MAKSWLLVPALAASSPAFMTFGALDTPDRQGAIHSGDPGSQPLDLDRFLEKRSTPIDIAPSGSVND